MTGSAIFFSVWTQGPGSSFSLLRTWEGGSILNLGADGVTFAQQRLSKTEDTLPTKAEAGYSHVG